MLEGDTRKRKSFESSNTTAEGIEDLVSRNLLAHWFRDPSMILQQVHSSCATFGMAGIRCEWTPAG